MTANRDDVQTETTRATTNSRREQLLPSRRQALDSLLSAVLIKGNGPLLLTGEPGTGKSWLYRRLIDELPSSWRAISVAMSEALDPQDFLRLVSHALGVRVANRVGSARLALSSALLDESASGRTWLLVVENAQDVSSQVWSEVLALVHDMEAARGFGALLLVGPTELARKLSTRPFASLASRLGAHAHLLPLDIDEARALLGFDDPMPAADLYALEKLHRDEFGNPRRMQRLWRKRPELSADATIDSRPAVPNLPRTATALLATTSEAARDRSLEGVGSHVAAEDSSAIREAVLDRESPARNESRSLVPSRPPLRVEDGLVEVGWKESFEAESAAMPAAQGEEMLSPLAQLVEGDESASEEIVEDHYAALQAWTEWARNRGRTPESPGASTQPQRPPRAAAIANLEELSEPLAAPAPNVAIRAEPQHEHAPYSQLFSRLRQSR